MDNFKRLLKPHIIFEVLCWVTIIMFYWYYDHWFHLKYSVEWSNSNFFTLSPTIKIEIVLAYYQFSLNHDHQKRTNIWQLINLHWINNIEKEKYYGKLSILTGSRISKLVEINILVVWFHLVYFGVQVPTCWWSKYSHSFIGTEGFLLVLLTLLCFWGHNNKLLYSLEKTWVSSQLYLSSTIAWWTSWQEFSIGNHRL